MIYEIYPNIPPQAGGVSARKGAARASERARTGQPFDQFQLSAQPTGQERRTLEVTARLSQDMRIRPTAGELSALQASIQNGSYQPDAREIAARMLLLGEV